MLREGKKRRAQASVEFLIVTGIGLFLISAVAVGFLSYTQQGSDNVRLSQVNKIGSSLLTQASNVYDLGGYSWYTVDSVMPDGVTAIYTTENNAIVFDVETQKGVVSLPVFSRIPITGVNTVGQKSFIYQGSISPHPGSTRFRVTSLGSVVQIEAVS